jgi:hypothetical protein
VVFFVKPFSLSYWKRTVFFWKRLCEYILWIHCPLERSWLNRIPSMKVHIPLWNNLYSTYTRVQIYFSNPKYLSRSFSNVYVLKKILWTGFLVYDYLYTNDNYQLHDPFLLTWNTPIYSNNYFNKNHQPFKKNQKLL